MFLVALSVGSNAVHFNMVKSVSFSSLCTCCAFCLASQIEEIFCLILPLSLSVYVHKLVSLCLSRFSCVRLSSVVSDSVRLYGLQPTRPLYPWGFSRQEYWSRLPCPSPGDLPNPGIEPRSPTLQADSLPSEPPGKPMNTRVGSLSLLQQESNWDLPYCR